MSNSSSEIRARRFPLRLPLRYRAAGSAEWYTGDTDNISCSGVLFHCQHALVPYTPVEITLRLPRQLCGEASLNMFCSGYVTRLIEPQSAQTRPALAIAFLDFRLLYTSYRPQAKLRQAERERIRKPSAELEHGLNSAVMIISGNCELLLAGSALPEHARKSVLRIKEAAERLGKLTGEL